MSTLPFAMSAAYRKFPEALFVVASPVYIDLFDELFTAMMAWLKFDFGAHPLIVPSSVANKNADGDPPTGNSPVVELLITIPVGDPGPFSPAVGISTFSCCTGFPAPS